MNRETRRRAIRNDPASPEHDAVEVRLRLIGQMEAWRLTSESILPVGRKTRALLAILAIAAPRPVMRGRLAELLWSRRPEEQARASLRQEIHRLLNTLDSCGPNILIVNRDYLAIRPGAVWVDVDEVMRATPAKPAALSLMDGNLLEDLDGLDTAFDAWLATERERLRDKARDLAEGMLRDQSEPDAAIRGAHQVLAIDRTHEGAWRALIGAHAARGERGMAIQAYDRCRAMLFDRLHTLPSEDTERLIAMVRASSGIVALSGGDPPPSSRPESKRNARVEPAADDDAGKRAHRSAEPPGGAARAGLRVGVMALQVLGQSEAGGAISIGLAEELAAGLARFRGIIVVSPATLAQSAGEARDEAAIRRAFDLHFLLDGSVQHAAGRVRITLRLLDLRAGNQIAWSRRFDRPDSDALMVQDEVAAEAAAQIDSELISIELQRSGHRPPAELTPQELLLRALSMMDRLERPRFMQAGDLLDRAVSQIPDFAACHGWYAFWRIVLIKQGWAAGPSEDGDAATRLAERAVMLDPGDAKLLAIAGYVRTMLLRGSDAALALHERALALNPNLPLAWGLSAATLACRGDIAEADRRLRRHRTLLPLDPHGFVFEAWNCIVALLRGDHAEAAIIGRTATGGTPFMALFQPYLSALGHLGNLAEAAIVRTRLLHLDPGFTLNSFLANAPFESAEHRLHFAAGLRAAGIPDS